jgi:hypothetical protein
MAALRLLSLWLCRRLRLRSVLVCSVVLGLLLVLVVPLLLVLLGGGLGLVVVGLDWLYLGRAFTLVLMRRWNEIDWIGILLLSALVFRLDWQVTLVLEEESDGIVWAKRAPLLLRDELEL